MDPVPTAEVRPERAYRLCEAARSPSAGAQASAADSDNGIALLPFLLAISGALFVGLATGSGLHLVRTSRRHATRPAT
jgi:hypothetical protein